MNPSKIREVVSWRGVEYIIPAPAYNSDSFNQDRYFFLKSGKSTPHSKLTSGDYCRETAKSLYSYLITHTPAGIYKELALLIIKGDLSCNNYVAELLGMSKKEVLEKVKKIKFSKCT